MIRLATAHRGALGLLAGLVLSASLLVSAVPRALEASFDAGVREVLTKSSPIAKALEVGWRGKFGESVAEVTASDALWRGMLPAAVREVADPEPLVRFSTVDPMRIDGRPGHLLFLRWVDSVDTRIRYVRGTPPGPRRDNRFQIALSAAVAAELTLLPALAIGAYGMATADGLVTARQLAAWQSVGAEIRVEREEGIPPDLVERIRRAVDAGGSHGRDIVPAAIGHVTAEVGYGGIPAIVAAIDLDAYRRLLQGTPLAGSIPAPPTAGTAGTGTTTATPALVSTDLAGMPSFEIDWPERLTVATRGVISSLPGVSTGDAALIVIPAMPEHTNRLFMSGDATAVRAVAPPGTLVTTLEEAADQIPGAPLASALVTGLRTVALALVCYALIAAAIAFVARGPERSRTLRLLGTLGLTTGQARVLTVLEVTPLLLLTTCAGVALGIGLPQLLGPAIELSAFTGPEANGQPFISVSSALWPAAGVILIALTGAYLGGNRARSG